MSCENLVCAVCAGPVVEGRCATCRTSRAHVHQGSFPLTPQMLALLIALLTIFSLLVAQAR
ncbi:MAG: hypothetical protein ABJC62_09615 [Frankiaceae bacterium]|jgi:hypothetical protein